MRQLTSPVIKRAIAMCVSLVLAFSGLVSSACRAGDSPTTPSPPTGGPGLRPDEVRVISMTADAIEIDGFDAARGGAFRLRVEGLQSSNPVYYVDGVLAGEVFGRLPRQATRPSGDVRLPAALPALTLLAYGLAVVSWSQILTECGGPEASVWLQGKPFALFDWESCTFAVAQETVLRLNKLVKIVPVTSEQLAVAIRRAMPFEQLREIIAREFSSFAEILEAIAVKFFEEVFKKLIAIYDEVLKGEPVDEADPDPDPVPVSLSVTATGPGKVTSSPSAINCPGTCSAEFPKSTSVTLSAQPSGSAVFSSWGGDCTGSSPTCSVSLTAAKNVSAAFTSSAPVQVWEGSFTAKGTFQLSSECIWRFDEEFSDVRLSLRDGTGTLTALVRTLEGPKTQGPAFCPDNAYVRQQNDAFPLVASWNGSEWSFELAAQSSIRTLRGTASSSGASGTYRLRSGALGAGGIRESNATFSLRPAR